MNRAYSLLQIKAVSEDQRIISGTATTPEVDRMGDIVDPLGVTFKNPLVLLHQHDSTLPVGTVTFDKPTKEGITFQATLPTIADPGPLKDRVDTAWGEIKAGLIRAVSIGFRALEYSFMDEGGIRYIASEILELSLVSVPANASAVISQIKSIDAPLLAATGKAPKASDRPVPPGVTGKSLKPVKILPKEGNSMKKTIAEQISAFEATRATKQARMDEIQSRASDEGRTKDAAEKEEFDTLNGEIDAIDAELKDLRAMQDRQAKSATPVAAKTPEEGTKVREGAIQAVRVVADANVPKGLQFARFAKVKALARLDGESARSIAKSLYGEDSVVYRMLTKAAVDAGTSISGNWAANLVSDETSAFADFVEFLRPMTIVGKFGTGNIPGLRNIPFDTPLITQTAGGSASWVGEGKPKPLTNFGYSRTTLQENKVAAIAVVTETLLRRSSVAAETNLRDELAKAVAERIDIDFIDPAKAASASVSPAAVTNGVSAIHSSGNDADAVREDVRAMMATFVAAKNTPTSGVWVMSSLTALGLSLMKNALGQPEFPALTMLGGVFEGLPVLTSEYVTEDTAGGLVSLINASDIWFADEGGVAVDMSNQASLEMKDSSLTQDATAGTGTSLVSLWQTNSVAFRAERILNWAKRRASAVAVLDQVNWGQPSS